MGLSESKPRRNSSQHAILFDVRTNGVRMEKSCKNSLGNLRLEYDRNHNQSASNLIGIRLNPSLRGHANCSDGLLTSCWAENDRREALWEERSQIVPVTVKREDRSQVVSASGPKWNVDVYDDDVGIYDTLPPITCGRCNGVYCNYTCHLRCRPLVRLDCTTEATEDDHGSLGNLTAVYDDGDAAKFAPLLDDIVDIEEPDPPLTEPISTNDLRRQIDDFNANVPGSEMKLLDDGKSFVGFIRVHMKLCRPINVVSTARPPSIYDVLYEDETTSEKTLMSFYLPRDTVKALHVSSDTTTKEVIITLLNKFKVVDNPHKFALYERYYEVGQSSKVRMRRIQDSEYPLQLVLMWNSQGNSGKHLVLQENDTGDIPWEAFSLPELSNFLRILQREEDEYLNQVRLKYSLMAEKLQEELMERKTMLAGGDPNLTAPIPPPRRRHSDSLVSGEGSVRRTSATLPHVGYESLPIERRQIRNVHSLRHGNLVTTSDVINGLGFKK